MNSPAKLQNKKAILVLGLSERDISGMVYHTQAQCDAVDQRWKIILESEIISDYVSSKDLHPYCLDAWNTPIKNKCIVELLERTEKLFDNEYVDVVIIGGSFAIDKSVRDIYADILKDQGYEVEFKFVETSWMSLFCESSTKGPSLLKLVSMWDQYNQSFVRQYTPKPGSPSAIIIDKQYDYSNEAINTMIKGCLESGIVLIALEDSYEDDSKPDYIKKISTFWEKIANYYNIQLVYETDAVTCHHWRMIGVPCISLTNPFALKYRI